MLSPKGLKPKSHKGISLKAYEERRKKKKKGPSLSRSKDWRKTGVRSWVGIPGDCQRLRIPETCNTAKLGLRQLKGKRQKKHKKWRVETSFSGTKGSKKSRELRETTHDARERYIEEPKWGTIKKEVAAKTFKPAKMNSAHLGKMTKRKEGQKLNHKRF